MVLTPMPCGSSSARRQSESMNTAALLVEYAVSAFCGVYAAAEDRLTTCPPVPRSIIIGVNARQP